MSGSATDDSVARADTRPTLALRHTLRRLGRGILLVALVLFGSAGSLKWPMAWVYLGLVVANIALTIVLILRRHPDLLVERLRIGPGAKRWDKVLAPMMAIGTLLPTFVVAGLERRGAWTCGFSPWTKAAGTALFLLGTALISWAMVTNRFFAPVVRIQTDRGHTVTTGGPYRFVRHPGYVGVMVCGLAVPLILGSRWGLVPAGAGWIIAIVRTTLEDRTLHAELAGYREYAQRVRYRLLPGVW